MLGRSILGLVLGAAATTLAALARDWRIVVAAPPDAAEEAEAAAE